MNTKTYVILSSKPWHRGLPERLQNRIGGSWMLIDDKKNFTLSALREIHPNMIFVPHWSYKISDDIAQEFETIIFHETDVPYGRGGSPIQNLIVRGHQETQISALRAEREVDSGPVYLKRPLSLVGSAQEIFERASLIIEDMICEIVSQVLIPVPQSGPVVTWRRRTPEESDISAISTLDALFDHIRMLDAEGYPHAFFENEYFRFEFKAAQNIAGKEILADVRIIPK